MTDRDDVVWPEPAPEPKDEPVDHHLGPLGRLKDRRFLRKDDPRLRDLGDDDDAE